MRVRTSWQSVSNIILVAGLLFSALLETVVFLTYRGPGWPLGKEGLEALGALAITLVVAALARACQERWSRFFSLQPWSVAIGLGAGLLWTTEIGMNNILQPPLPERDIYDDVFWAGVALVILVGAAVLSWRSRSLRSGIASGLWSGLASGMVACLTALAVIVFGMPLLLRDPLNVMEWSARGPTSQSHSMAVYFADQTLAGAMLHLLVLGVVMGGILGFVGGVIARVAVRAMRG